MNTLDILIAIILLGATFQGWRRGFVKEIFGFVGFFLGLYLANLLYGQVGYLIAPHLDASPTFISIIAFILIWVGVPLALWFFGSLLTRFLKFFCLGTLNSFFGMVLCIIKTAFLAGLLANVLTITKLIPQQLEKESVLYTPISNTSVHIFELAKQQWQKK